jgi:hypothetical protein
MLSNQGMYISKIVSFLGLPPSNTPPTNIPKDNGESFNGKVAPSMVLGKQVGNSYCGSLYNGMASLVDQCADAIATLPGAQCKFGDASNPWKPADAVTSPNGAAGWEKASAKDRASIYYTETITRYFREEHLGEGSYQGFADTLAKLGSSPGAKVTVSLNYALGHAGPGVKERAEQTMTHPDVVEALGAVMLSRHRPPFPANSSTTIDQEVWQHWQEVRSDLEDLLGASAGSYANLGSYMEEDWPERYWGSHYQQLLQLKAKYDPDGLFTCYQCVGDDPAPAGTSPQCSEAGRRLVARPAISSPVLV